MADGLNMLSYMLLILSLCFIYYTGILGPMQEKLILMYFGKINKWEA